MTGKIIFLGLDLGNIDDLTIRQLNVLRNNKIFIVEHKGGFIHKLNLLKILNNKQIYEWPGESEEYITKIILDNINKGLDVVYCAMEGMPCTTDPGSALTRIAVNNNIKYTVYPGPSIVSTMPILNGWCCGYFVYGTYIPKDDNERLTYLKQFYNYKLPFTSTYPSRNTQEIKTFCFKFIDEIISIFSENTIITFGFNITYWGEQIITLPAKHIKSALETVDFTDIEVVSVLVVPDFIVGNCT